MAFDPWGLPALRILRAFAQQALDASGLLDAARMRLPLHRHDPRFRHAQRYRRRTGSARCYCTSQRCADILRSMSARGSNGLPQQLGGDSLAFWALQFGAR
jgi:hypothetical protein